MTTAFSSVHILDPGAIPGNDTASSPYGHQASHTRACTNCVRAKAKCYTNINGRGKCERCQRMNKDCQPSPPVRKRRMVKKSPASKTSKLEEKLDGIVTLLKSATQVTPEVVIHGASINSPTDGSISSVDQRTSNLTPNTNDGPSSDANGFPESCLITPSLSLAASSPRDLQPILDPALQPSSEDAESYLDKFRTVFMKNLPFIVISPSMTAHQLRQERPILWLCIMTVASNNVSRQIALSKEVRKNFGREAFVDGTKNMDILLAVLVYTAWDRHQHFERSILINLLQFAVALLYDLGLDKPAMNDPVLQLVCKFRCMREPSRSPRSTEERRAYLGCFLISSVLTSRLRRGVTIPWSAYSDECLRILETQKEFASDAFLIQLVKLRLLSERVAQIPWSGPGDVLARLPATFYLKSLEAELHHFKSNVPDELMDNKVLLMEIHNVELDIHEIGLSEGPDIFCGQHNRRLECLFECHKATKSWMDVFLGISPAEYVGFSSSTYMNMGRCLISTYRLATCEHPEWDWEVLNEHFDVSLVLAKAANNFAQVKQAADLTSDGLGEIDFFTNMATKFRGHVATWDAMHANTMSSLSTPPGDEMGDFTMDFLDDEWLKDLLFQWNE